MDLAKARSRPDIGEIAIERRMKFRKVDKKKPGGGMAVPANISLFRDRPECGNSWRQIAACQAVWLEPCPHSPPAWR
jgi:hypothetical protein